MYQLVNRRGNILGQFQPFLTPTMPVLDAANGTSSPVAASTGGDTAKKVAVAGGSLIVGAIAATSALFAYGIAKDSQSKLVRTTGYILAGVNGLGALAYIVGGPLAAMLSGARK